MVPATVRNRIKAVLGIVAMRRGEIENCLECAGPFELHFSDRKRGPSSESLRLARGDQMVHELSGGVAAGPANHLAAEHRVHDAGRASREGAAAILDPGRRSRSKAEVAPFENIAIRAGMGVRGPNLAGGSIFDDFNGDNLPDLFTTSLDAELGATLLINRGDGRFEDRSTAAGLARPGLCAQRHARRLRQRR